MSYFVFYCYFFLYVSFSFGEEKVDISAIDYS